jgi:aryl-alcohol dehydrogenase-like predicted oxidoreductase
MKHVSLGGLDVSRIGLGAMTMAGTAFPAWRSGHP